MSFKIQTEDRYIYRKDLMIMYLYECLLKNQDIEIRFEPEGPCAESLGLYGILDNFCSQTGYPKKRITLVTANMIEHHEHYQIKKSFNYWYEVFKLQSWAKEQKIITPIEPKYHFGCFVGRARWPRVWISTWLWKNYRNKTLQTFHSSLRCHYRTEPTDGVYDWLGLEDLLQNQCDFFAQAVEFLEQSPLIIEDDLERVKNTKILWEQPTHYPLQHPANLTIIDQYSKIFVDIVCEPNVSGRCFLSTEKLWRCMLARRPFILIGCAEHLQNLRQLGFKTWHDWWCEDYDGQSNKLRLSMIQEVLDQIANWPVEKLSQTLEQMRRHLDHNYERFMSLSKKDFREVFGAE